LQKHLQNLHKHPAVQITRQSVWFDWNGGDRFKNACFP